MHHTSIKESLKKVSKLEAEKARQRRDLERSLAYAVDAGDVELLLAGFRQLAHEKGMGKIARLTGIGRSVLYRVIAPGSNPKLRNVFQLLDALNIEIRLTAIDGRPLCGNAEQRATGGSENSPWSPPES